MTLFQYFGIFQFSQGNIGQQDSVDQMYPKLILSERSLQKDQKTYFNHSHISNIRGVMIKNIWDPSGR